MHSFETFLGIDESPQKSTMQNDKIATRNMTEDEELNYVYEKYIKEPDDNVPHLQTVENSMEADSIEGRIDKS